MAMLAEPRRKQKVINLRAKNSAWSNDANKFGQRMLEKMGWAPGKGLGAKENGIVEHVIAKYKNDERGLGFEDKNDQWTKHEDDFNSLLANLSNAEGDDKLISGVSLEDKSKKSKARVHYHKFTRGKDISRYSKKDLANIFGKKSFDVKKETEENDQEDSKITEKVFTEKGSMHDYFKSKLAAFKSKPTMPVLNNNQNEDDEANYAFQGFSNADIIEDTNSLNENVSFQPFSFVNTNKDVEAHQSSENVNIKKSKKSKKDKGDDCDEKEQIKKTKRKKRKNAEINESYSKSNENELTDQNILSVEEHDANEVPKKKKQKKKHLHNTENLEQNQFIENQDVINGEIVNQLKNDIDTNSLNENVSFQPFSFVNSNSNTNKDVEAHQSSENVNIKKSKKSKKEKGDDCDEKEQIKKTKRKKRKNAEINESYSKSNENELTNQNILSVEEHDANEVPKKKKQKKKHLHNTENLEQNQFIENQDVINGEIVNQLENDIHNTDQICTIVPKKKKSKNKESQDTICESVEEHFIYKKKKKKKEKSLKGTTVVGVKENCEVPEELPNIKLKELLVTNNHMQQKSKFQMPKQRKTNKVKTLSESDEISSEQSITNKERNNGQLSYENIQDNIKSDIQELKSIYSQCKTVVGNFETKYGHLIDRLNLPSGKKSTFSSVETDCENDECNCFLNTRIVYGEDGKPVTQEPRKDNHICTKKLKKQHGNALIPNANHCNASPMPLWVKNEQNIQIVDTSAAVFQLPNDLLTLASILRDPDIVDENYRNIVLAKVNSLKKEFRDEIHREKNDLIKAAKEDADSVFHFTGSNLSSVAMDDFY